MEEEDPAEAGDDVVDAKSGKPVDANLTIEGMVFDQVVEAKGRSHYEYDMDIYRNLQIGCVRRLHVPFQQGEGAWTLRWR